ncbi:cytochrome c [Magnetovirga frankeli]|uniref:c-type cytochrome n=1 Tax=Magnetovirga frankeli TaxID=947516 RepID=UPI001292D47E|nr:cytochrome c [gamma proteobacterium SS-5]
MPNALLAASLLLISGLPLVGLAAAEPGTGPSPARQLELRALLVQDCGSCHGLSLRGGLGPQLLPEALANKPEEYLVATILHGRPGTPMPPWQHFLSEDEARWIAQLLKRGLQ